MAEISRRGFLKGAVALALASGLESLVGCASPKIKESIAQKETKNPAWEYFCKGFDFNHDKQYDEAIGQLTKAIEYNPEFVEAYHQRGIAWYSKAKESKTKDDYQKAINDFSKALEIGPMHKSAKALKEQVQAELEQIGNESYAAETPIGRFSEGRNDCIPEIFSVATAVALGAYLGIRKYLDRRKERNLQ